MEQVRKLPLGIQSFEIIRENGYQYVINQYLFNQ